MTEGCRAYFWFQLSEFIKEYQTLISGILALIAALISIILLHNQIQQNKIFERDRLQRKSLATKAGLPSALADISNYSVQCIFYIHNMYNFWINDDIESIERQEPPRYPAESFKTVQYMVEVADTEDADILADFLALSQIQNSRLSNLYLNTISHLQGGENLVIRLSFYSAILDAVGIYKDTDRLFLYARRDDPNNPHIPPLCKVGSVLDTLRVRMRVRDEEILEYVQRRWPPRLRDSERI